MAIVPLKTCISGPAGNIVSPKERPNTVQLINLMELLSAQVCVHFSAISRKGQMCRSPYCTTFVVSALLHIAAKLPAAWLPASSNIEHGFVLSFCKDLSQDPPSFCTAPLGQAAGCNGSMKDSCLSTLPVPG